MRRVLALALALVAACADESDVDCPGEPVATFHFTGTKVDAGDPSIAALDPVPATPECGETFGYDEAPLEPFYATLTADLASSAAALCRTRGPVLIGPRTGDRYLLETSTDGAVLGEECAPTCSAELRLLVAGDVVRVDGEAASFSGVLVEVMSKAAGSECGACTLPCAARYALQGTR